MGRGVARAKVAIVVVLTTIAIAAVGCSPAAAGRIELSSTDVDLGEVLSTEQLSHVFQVRNAGTGSLSITGVSTSCGCTTAEISATSLAPGLSADLLVTFDPQAHSGATGDFTRQVYIRSSDPDTPEAVLTFHITVVDPKTS